MPRVTPRFAGSPPNLRLPLIWNTGLGALTHVQGPADQDLTIAAGASRNLYVGGSAFLSSEGYWYTALGMWRLFNTGQYQWSSTGAGAGVADTGLARAAAGVMRASDGSTGMGKVMAEEFQVSSDSTSRAKLKVTKVTKAHDSDLFNAAGLTDSVVVYTQPANSILVAAYAVLDTQFAAVGMTDLDVTLGDAGNNAGILNATGNYTSDAATTAYKTKGAYFEATAGLLLAEAATDITAYATAVGANLDTTSAGSISFYFVTFEW